MLIVDISIILLILLSCYKGYKRGTLNELYDLIVLIITAILTFSFKTTIGMFAFETLNLSKTVSNNFDSSISNVIENFSLPYIGMILGFIIFYLILKLIVFIAIKMSLLPKRMRRFNFIGGILAGAKTIIFFTFIAFLLSFGFIIDKEYIYDDSLLLKPIFKINSPLFKLGKDLKEIYIDMKTLEEALSNKEDVDSVNELTKIIKKIKETDLITENNLEDIAEGLIFNEEKIDVSDLKIEEIKNQLILNEEYELIKSLYKEEVITDDLIFKVLENNKIEGIQKEDINYLFE